MEAILWTYALIIAIFIYCVMTAGTDEWNDQ